MKLTKHSFEGKLHDIYIKLTNLYNQLLTNKESDNNIIFDIITKKLTTYGAKLSSKSINKISRDIANFNDNIYTSKFARLPYYYKLFNIYDNSSSRHQKNEPLYVDMTNGLLDDITEAEVNILNYGLKFIITPENVDIREEIANIGVFAHNLKKSLTATGDESIDNHNKKRINDTINTITSEVLEEKLHKVVPKQNLTREEKSALLKLSNRPNLIFKKADKGSQLVVMREDEYNSKIQTLLDDANTYKKLDEDPTLSILKDLTSFLEDALWKGQITTEEQCYLTPSNPRPGFFDGLPKTHKSGCPIRPIVSQTNTVTRKLSEYVEKKLHPYVTRMESYNRDTMDVINYINGINREQILSKHANILLLTMDIDSFYTNVQRDLSVDSISKLLKKNGYPAKNIDFMNNALKFIFDNNNFIFNRQHFIQLTGMSMGSPCASSVCSLTFYMYEIEFLKKNPKLLFWKRHIDDIFTIFAGTDRQLQLTIKKFTEQSSFTFTHTSSSTSVDFLDVTIGLNKNKIVTTKVYRHPAKIPVYTHMKSCQSLNTKKSIIKSSCIRFRRICSSLNSYDTATKDLKFKLASRGHTPQVIDSFVKDIRNNDRSELLKHKPAVSDNSNNTVKPLQPRLCLTYIPGITDKIVSIVKKHWNQISDLLSFPLSCSFKNSNTKISDILSKKVHYPAKLNYKFVEDTQVDSFDINTIINTNVQCPRRSCITCKDHYIQPSTNQHHITVKDLEISLPCNNINCESENLIYLISCNMCDNQHYVGETQQMLRDRLYGHRSTNSILNKHFTTNNHILGNMKVIILYKVRGSKSTIYRRGLEYFYLMTLKPAFNADLEPP